MRPNSLEALKLKARERANARFASGGRGTVNELLRRRARRNARKSLLVALLSGGLAAVGTLVLATGLI